MWRVPHTLFLLLATALTATPDPCTLATRFSTEHDFTSGLPLWETLVSSYPDATLKSTCPQALVFYGVSLLTMGIDEIKGGNYLDRAIALDPFDYIAHSFLGAIHEKLTREAHLTGRNATLPLHSAIAHFKAALAYRSRPRTQPYPQSMLARPLTYLYRSLGACFLWSGQKEAAAALYQEAVAGGEVGWTNVWARPALPLPLRPPFPLPFIPRGAHPALSMLLDTLEAHIARIRQEYQRYSRSHSHSHGNQSTPNGGGWQRESGGLETSGGWQVLTLAVDGVANATLCRQSFPLLCSLLQASPLANSTRMGQVKFSVLQPGASILPHAGPSIARLRVHCTLQGFGGGAAAVAAVLRVGEESHGWKEGECFVFDESFEHEVVGVGEGAVGVGVGVEGGVEMHSAGGGGGQQHPRVVLLVDIPNLFLASLVDFKRHAVSDLGWSLHGKELKGQWKAALS